MKDYTGWFVNTIFVFNVVETVTEETSENVTIKNT